MNIKKLFIVIILLFAFTSSAQCEFDPGIRYVSVDSLNLRSEPNTESKIITTMKKNSILFIKEEEGDWAYVRTTSKLTGWVNKKYLTRHSSVKSYSTNSNDKLTITDSKLKCEKSSITGGYSGCTLTVYVEYSGDSSSREQRMVDCRAYYTYDSYSPDIGTVFHSRPMPVSGIGTALKNNKYNPIELEILEFAGIDPVIKVVITEINCKFSPLKNF